ncbi:MAG: hypothetical protein K8T26_06005 [Lentisphaerae bacterium]|nr:hypothetical protein [Lentisphaerota bacterium]
MRTTWKRFADEVLALPAWDTHNHLDSSEHLGAQTFWDIAHYFWFVRELESTGYPANADELPEAERATAFVQALDRGRNTTWNHVLRESMQALFGVTITDARSVGRLNARIRETAADPAWAREVCRRAGLTKLTIVPDYRHNGLERLADLHCYYGHVAFGTAEEHRRAAAAADPLAAADELARPHAEAVAPLAASGIRTVRAWWPFGEGEPPAGSVAAVQERVGHRVYEALNAHRMNVQLFIGMAGVPGLKPRNPHDARPSVALNDPRRLYAMNTGFGRYPQCTFEIFNAADQSSMDIVNMARVFPNVIPGGLWWFAYRGSVYNANMQYRFEALPACKATMLATDARCIEWAYIKTWLVKRLMARFLHRQIEDGWTDTETALYAARSWLHDTAASLYVPAAQPNVRTP